MAETLIGSSVVIDGEITGADDLVIAGTVKGRIETEGTLSVEESAQVEAEVEAGSATISGRLIGNVVARERVELRPNGRLIGDVKAPRLTIADGAAFKGTIDMGG